MRRAALAGAVGLAAGFGAAALARGGRSGRGTASPGWATCSAPGARTYDLTFGRALTGLHRAMAADLRSTAGTPLPGRVVDVGAGPGGLVVALAGVFPDALFTAVDIDPAMAALARARMAREAIDGRVEVIVGDVAALPLAEASADLITSSFSVHHWPDATAGFAQLHRILRPGGRAVIYDLADWWGRFETGAPPLLDAARAGGFAVARVDWLAWPGSLRIVRRLEASR